MKCANHLEKDAVAVCNHCGKSICADCQVQSKGENYCRECIAAGTGGTRKEERSPALAAILSFVIAGLGQIYNGQVGKGILIFVTSWLIIPWIIGIFDAYKTAGRINRGEIAAKNQTGCLIAFIVGIVVMWVGIMIIALLAAIAIPNLLRARLTANEAAAETALSNIAKAVESYRAGHAGSYPKDESELIGTGASDLKEPYSDKIVYGYKISESFTADGYKLVAEPAECNITGSRIIIMETGGVISSRDCNNNTKEE